MRITINADELARAMKIVNQAVPGRSTLPVLSNVAVEAEEKGVIIRATNLETEVILSDIEADIGATGGVLLPAKALASIAREMGDCDISIDASEDKASLLSGSASFQINAGSIDDYPGIMQAEECRPVSTDASVIADGFSAVLPFASSDETRYMLNGVRVESEPLTFIATDGRRLAINKPDAEVDGDIDPAIIPAAAAQLVLRSLGGYAGNTAILATSARTFTVACAGLRISGKTIEGKYPDWRTIMPTECNAAWSMDRVSLVGAVKRVLAAITDQEWVQLELADNKLKLLTKDQHGNHAEEFVDVATDHEVARVRLSHQFLMDALRVPAQEVELRMIDEASPFILQAGGYKAVIMPLKIGGSR